MENTEVIKVPSSIEMMNQIEKASIDMQITTAKQYPRDLRKSVENCIATVTMNLKTASTCGYTLRFRGSEIKGKSVYLARIMAQNWGNFRCEQSIVGADATHVIGQGICHDLETNYAVRLQVRKPIIKKDGTRYSNDMIATAGMAAAAIALRNAILQVIPQAFSDEVYEAAERKVIGKLSEKDTLLAERKKILAKFKNDFKVSEEQILKHFEIRTTNQLDAHKVKELIDMANAFKDGQFTVDEIFGIPENAELSKDLNTVFDEANRSNKQDGK